MKTILFSMLFASVMFAESVTLTSVNGARQNGFYVSPYMLSIDGAAPVEVWCVDFLDHVTVGETWDATITPNFGAYFPAGDYAAMLGIIQAELNDPDPDIVGYQDALWGLEDTADFGPPTGIYLADESTPLTTDFYVIEGVDPADPGRPQAFIADGPEPGTLGLLVIAIGVLMLATRRKRGA